MNDLETANTAAASTPQTGKSPLYAIVDVAVWLWPRRRLLVAELRTAHARRRAPKQPKRPSRTLRFAV